MKQRLSDLARTLATTKSSLGVPFSQNIIPGDVEILQVIIQDREEFPIYVTIDNAQILCITHLWQEQEIKTEQRENLLDALITMNVPMPLSSFSKVGHQYIIFGALASTSNDNEIIHEIETLSDNTLDAIEAITEFLN